MKLALEIRLRRLKSVNLNIYFGFECENKDWVKKNQ